MIVIIFCCIVGLGYLGQTTNGESLVKSNKETERYIPQKIRKYKPIKNYNADEAKLSDANYADSIEEALV